MSQEPQQPQGDATGGIIPYKNVPALIGYYLAVFSLIPCVGLPLGLAAVVLGLFGLKVKSKHPEAKGTAHALVALILGGVTSLLWGGLLVFFIVALASEM